MCAIKQGARKQRWWPAPDWQLVPCAADVLQGPAGSTPAHQQPTSQSLGHVDNLGASIGGALTRWSWP